MLADVHLLIESPLLGQVADLGGVVAAEGGTLEKNLPGVGCRDRRDHADQAGLTGPVWAEQAEDCIRWHGEGDVVHGHFFAVGLTHVAYLDHGG